MDAQTDLVNVCTGDDAADVILAILAMMCANIPQVTKMHPLDCSGDSDSNSAGGTTASGGVDL
jgi:hypothetical protein